MFTYLKNLQYKELFLSIFFFTFIIGTFIISVVSLTLGQISSFFVTGFSFIFGLYILWCYRKEENIEKTSIMLLWTIAFIVFAHIFINHFGIDIVYILVLPMTAPILLSRKQLKFHGLIYLLITMSILLYGYFTNEFNNPNSISSFIILSLFVILFGSTYHFAIEESYKKLEESNRQKDFLLKEIHHRVKNNLNIVASILGLEKFETNIDEVHKLINQNKLRIESIAMVHEILYKSEDLENIDFKTYITKLTNHILVTEAKKEEIAIHLDIVPLKLNIESMIQFGIIINELLTNSIKHAFPDDTYGTISIILEKHEHYYKLIYKDNGIGLHTQKTGFGQNLIKISTKQLNADLNIINKQGLIYEFSFKKEEL